MMVQEGRLSSSAAGSGAHPASKVAQSTACAPKSSPWPSAGSQAVLCDLQGRLDLNGAQVRVEHLDTASGRWKCIVSSTGESVNVRPENIRLVAEVQPSKSREPRPGDLRKWSLLDLAGSAFQFLEGDVVEVVGLESEEGKLVNGQIGGIVRYVDEKSRFDVR